MPFPYKTVLITGATSGLGLALAERMILDGVFVIAVGRREDRLKELVNKHGSDKVAGEAFDISDLAAQPEWVKKVIATYPSLDCIFLNAGFQRGIDFTEPDKVDLDLLDSELHTNYLSPVHTIKHFLPHLMSVAPRPAGILFMGSGLAVIPIPRVPNYSASKSAMHSFVWSLRAQLSAPGKEAVGGHIRVREIIPPAVQTELFTQQPDLIAAGQTHFGEPLAEFADETWVQLRDGDDDELMVQLVKERWGDVEVVKKKKFQATINLMRSQKTLGLKWKENQGKE